jgi:hypothetical protein
MIDSSLLTDNLTTCLNTDTVEFDSATRSLSFTVYDSEFGYKHKFYITFDNLVMLQQKGMFNMKDKFFY